MGLHQQRDLAFEAPPDWFESTVAAFKAPATEVGPEIVLLVAREPLMPNDTLEGHMGRTLLKLGKELDDVVMGETRELEVGARRALSVRVEFEASSGRFEQTLVMVDPTRDPDGQVWVFVSTAPLERREEASAALERVLFTARFEAPEEPPKSFEALPPVPMPALRPGRP